MGRERQVGLRVTPRTLGLRLGGSAILPRSTTGSDLYWCESDVKRVTWDLGGEMVSPLSSALVATNCEVLDDLSSAAVAVKPFA